jgi:hypothetical protein
VNIRTMRLKRAVAGLVAAGVASSVAVIATGATPVNAAAPGTPPTGPLVMLPSSGSSGSDWNFAFGPGVTDQFCNDTGVNGWRFHSFIVERGTDPATLDFPVGFATDPGGAFAAPLFTTAPNPAVNSFPSPTSNPNEGFVNVGAITYSFEAPFFSAANPDFPGPGEYTIGVACTDTADDETSEYWSTNVTLIPSAGAGPNNFTYIQGVAPAAPTGVVATGQDGALSVAFTGDSEATSFTVTVSGGGLGSPITQSGTTSPIVVSGLTNGVTYDVTVSANKAGFPSATSATVQGTPVASPQPPVTGLSATALPGGNIEVTWTAPAGETAVRDGYTVTADDGVNPPIVQTLAAGATSTTIPGVVGTTYVITVVATYPAPDAGTPRTVSATSVPNAVIEQVITAERPEGALIFTQRCGVNDPLAAVPAGAFNGWTAAGLPSVDASADQLGSAPLFGGAADPNFGEYPYPIDEATGIPNPNYVTTCGIDLGRAALVTEVGDPYRGSFFRTQGNIDQITVVDTRNDDNGWTLTGTMGSFVSGSQTFSGDYLGWIPVASDDSDGNSINTYDQVAVAGATVFPAIPGGLGDGATLGSAAAGSGLGIAEFDARLLLLIPISADSGQYTGTLSYTLV